MSEAETVVVRRDHVNRRELERHSRPDSAHKGNLKRLKTSSVSGFQRWEKENELLWAMLEDETEWLAKLFPDIIITPELFFYALEDGVVLCRLANLIQEKAEEYGKKNKVKVSGETFKFHTNIPKKNKQLALFKSRENVQGFLTWCRQLGISDSILFESNDIVEADECREGCREVVICLMEIARRASGRFKFTPIPKLIQLEKEIEEEEQQDAEKNELDQVDYGSSDDDSKESNRSPGSEDSSPPSGRKNGHATPGRTKKRPKNQHPKSELDNEVFKIIDNFNVYNIRKLKEGKYIILGKIIFVRMLNGHVLLRIGGGWDTLEHYLLTHIPKAAAEVSGDSSETPIAPSVSKTPQKSQLTKILDKAKKEQQLKATPVSSPYRAAVSKQDESSEDDEKDITSAIRKIELSVNQNIATRRKHSKATAEDSPQKSPTTPEQNQNIADINQNNIEHENKTLDSHLNRSPQRNLFSESCSKKMESETCERENGFTEQDVITSGEMNFDLLQQNGGEKLRSLEGAVKDEDSDDKVPFNSEIKGADTEQSTDSVDGGIGTTAQETTDKIGGNIPSETLNDSLEAPTSKAADTGVTSATQEGNQAIEDTVQDSCNGNIDEQTQSLAPEQLSPTAVADTIPTKPDNAACSDSVANNSDSPTPAPEIPTAISALKSNSSSSDKKGAESPKKKPSKNTKEPMRKPTSSKTGTAKKEVSTTATSTRPKSAQPKTTRATTSNSTAAKTKQPTSGAKTTTSSTASKTSSGAATAKKTSPTRSATSKKPATKPETKTSAPGRPVAPSKAAFGSTVSKPAAKKPDENLRPGTAPAVRSTQPKGKTVAAKVQTGLSSRPQSARPTTKAATTAASKGGGTSGKAPGKASKGGATVRPTSPAKAATAVHKDAPDGAVSSKVSVNVSKEVGTARPGSPTKPLVRKTQTRTVTTLKTTRTGASGEPEVKSQTLKTTKTVTEANGKKTTKTTVKEVAPAGRKPLRLTKTETTEQGGKKTTSGGVQPKTDTRTAKPGAKKPEPKGKVGGAGRVGSAGAKTTQGAGTKKTATKAGVKSEEKVSSHLKGTVPKAKTVKELSNALGVTKPVTVKETSTSDEAKVKPDETSNQAKDETTPTEQVAKPAKEMTKPGNKATEPAAEVAPEPVAEVETEPVAEVGTEIVAEVETEPVAEVETEPVAEAEKESVAEVAPEPVAEMETEPVAEVETEPPVAEVEKEPVAEVAPEPVAEVETEPVAEVEKEPVAEVETEPVAEAEKEPVAEVAPEPVAEMETEPVAEVETEPPVAEVEKEPVAEVAPEPVAEVETEPVAEVEKEPVAEVETEPVAAVETEPVAAVETEPVAAVETEPVAAVETEPVAAVETEPVAAVETEPVAAVETEPVAAVETEPVAAVETEPVAAVETEPVAAVETEPVTEIATEPAADLTTSAEDATAPADEFLAEEPSKTNEQDTRPDKETKEQSFEGQAEDVVSGEGTVSPEGTPTPQDFDNGMEGDEKDDQVVITKNEQKAVQEVHEHVVEKVDEEAAEESGEITVKNDVEEAQDKLDDVNNETIDTEAKEFIEKQVETGESLDQPVTREETSTAEESEVMEENKISEQVSHEVLADEENKRDHNKMDKQLKDLENDNARLMPESCVADLGVQSFSYTASTTTTDEKLVIQSQEEKVVEYYEKIVEESEVTGKGQSEQEVLEDSLDVIHVPDDDVSLEPSTFERTEAWPPGDNQQDVDQDVEEEGGEKGSSLVLSEEQSGEQLPSRVVKEEKPSIDPFDSQANQAYAPSELFEIQGDTQESSVARCENNNNILEENRETSAQSNQDLLPVSLVADESSSSEFSVAGESNSDPPVMGQVPAQMEVPEFSNFQEFTGFHGNANVVKEESPGEHPSNVDDLLG